MENEDVLEILAVKVWGDPEMGKDDPLGEMGRDDLLGEMVLEVLVWVAQGEVVEVVVAVGLRQLQLSSFLPVSSQNLERSSVEHR